MYLNGREPHFRIVRKIKPLSGSNFLGADCLLPDAVNQHCSGRCSAAVFTHTHAHPHFRFFVKEGMTHFEAGNLEAAITALKRGDA